MLNRSFLSTVLVGLMLLCVGCETSHPSSRPSNTRYRRPVDPFASSYPTYAAPSHEVSTSVSTAPTNATSRSASNGSSDAPSGAARLPYASPISIEKTVPSEVAVGSDFEYRLVVRNTTNTTFRNVTVTEEFSPNFALSAAGPKTSQLSNTQATWQISQLGPQQSQVIRIIGKAKTAGSIQGCSAVTFSPHLCTVVNATQASLRLVKAAPAEIGICDRIPIRFTVTNIGSSVARGVVIHDEGLRNTQGLPLTLNVGDIPSRQARTVEAQLTPNRVGRFSSKAIATGAGGIRAEATSSTNVTQPVLAITQDGPGRVFLGKDATFNITVTNKADCSAMETVVEQHLSPGTKVTGVSAGGQVNGNRVAWNLGTLGPNQSRRLSMTIQQTTAGVFTGIATAKSRCAKQVSVASRATAKGIPAILLEVMDATDPIEVGQDVTYVIKVTNQGTAPGTNIVVKCDLEATMQYMGSEGATNASVVGNTVSFAPLARLAPKAAATYRVRIKATRNADARFTTALTSDQISRPVTETEATNFYE